MTSKVVNRPELVEFLKYIDIDTKTPNEKIWVLFKTLSKMEVVAQSHVDGIYERGARTTIKRFAAPYANKYLGTNALYSYVLSALGDHVSDKMVDFAYKVYMFEFYDYFHQKMD